MRELTKLLGLTNSLLKLATSGNADVTMDPVRLDECMMRAIADVKRNRTRCTISFEFGTLPERFGPWNSIYQRFRPVCRCGWAKAGVWQDVFDKVQEPDLDWTLRRSDDD